MTVIVINCFDASAVYTAADVADNYNSAKQTNTSTGLKIADLIDTSNVATGIALYVDAVFSGKIDYASAPATAFYGLEPQWWAGAWYTNGTATLLISGFYAGQTGTIRVAGSASQAVRDTDFTINGITQRYDTGSDVLNPATAPLSFSFTADGSGDVSIDITVVSTFGYINGVEVTYTPTPPDPVIDDVNGDNEVEVGTETTINGENLDDVTINGVRLQDSTATYTQDQTIGSQSASAIVIDSLSLGDVPRSSASHQIQMRVTDGTTPDTQNITILDAAGFVTTEIQSDLGTDQSIAYLINGGTVANGSQLYGPTTTRGGATITYFADGHVEIGPGSTEPDYIDDIQLWTALGGWTTAQDIQVTDGGGTAVAVDYINGLAQNAQKQVICTETFPTEKNYVNGLVLANGGILYIVDVTLSSVTNPSFVNGLCLSSRGALFVTTGTPQGANYVNGFRLRSDGALYVTEDTPTSSDAYINGLVFSPRGQLRIVIN